MTTIASDLVTRVRSNINEPSTQVNPLRTDLEIIRWLQDGVSDYLSRVPVDAMPTLLAVATFSGSNCSFPTDYLKIAEVLLTHTVSGTTVTAIDKAYMLGPEDGWMAQNWPGVMGAWCHFSNGKMNFGPFPASGTVSYIKLPVSMSTASDTFGLPTNHEEPIVNYATVMALNKVNDADAERYLGAYNARVSSERAKYGSPSQEPK